MPVVAAENSVVVPFSMLEARRAKANLPVRYHAYEAPVLSFSPRTPSNAMAVYVGMSFAQAVAAQAMVADCQRAVMGYWEHYFMTMAGMCRAYTPMGG